MFDKYGQEGSPFDLVTEEAVEEDIMANGEAGGLTDDDDESDEDMPIELKRDYVDEHIGDTPPARPPQASRRLSHSKVISARCLSFCSFVCFINLCSSVLFCILVLFYFYIGTSVFPWKPTKFSC